MKHRQLPILVGILFTLGLAAAGQPIDKAPIEASPDWAAAVQGNNEFVWDLYR